MICVSRNDVIIYEFSACRLHEEVNCRHDDNMKPSLLNYGICCLPEVDNESIPQVTLESFGGINCVFNRPVSRRDLGIAAIFDIGFLIPMLMPNESQTARRS